MANWNSFVDDDEAKQNDNSADSGSPGPTDGASKRHPTKIRHNSDDEKGKLFVGGLSWETTQDNLKDFFMKFGEVVDCVVMSNQETGRSRGFGFITFSDPSNVDLVLSTGPHILDGRTVDPKPCNPRNSQNRGMRSSYPKIFLGGLPSTVTETSLKQFFATYGKVTEVVIMYDQEKKKSRGFGFLSFETEESVDRCVAERYVNINGKQVEIKKAEPRGEYRSGGGRGRGRMGDQSDQQGDGSWNMGAAGAAQGMSAGYPGWGAAGQQQQYPPGWGPQAWPGQTQATGPGTQMPTAQPGQMENWYAQQGQWGYGQGYGNWGWGQGYGQGMQAPNAGAPPPPPPTQPPPPPPPTNDNQGAATQASAPNKGAAYPQQYPQMGTMPQQSQYGAMAPGYGQNAPPMGMYNQPPAAYGGQSYPNAGNSGGSNYGSTSGGAAPPQSQSGSQNQNQAGGPQRPNYGQQQQPPSYHPYRRN